MSITKRHSAKSIWEKISLKWFFRVLFVVLLLLVIVQTLSIYTKSRNDALNAAMQERQSGAKMAALILSQNFDRVVDVGISLTTRTQFRKNIADGKWNEAINILKSVPSSILYVERVSLFSPDGTLQALYPEIPDIIGKNFSYRDYYKGVSAHWEPYVSGIFMSATTPSFPAITVTLPIKDEKTATPIGILLLQLKLDRFTQWANGTSLGGVSTFAYFIDRDEHIVGHPTYPSTEKLIDVSTISTAKAITAEKKDKTAILYDEQAQVERIVSYSPLPTQYGWGVVVEQPTSAALAQQQKTLVHTHVLQGGFLLLYIFLWFVLLSILNKLNESQQKEKFIIEGVGDGLFAIDKEWNITLWNPASAKISGWSSEEAVGQPLRKIVRFVKRSDRSENVLFISDAMMTGTVRPMSDNTVLIRKDATEVDVSDSASPLFDENGQVTGAIVIFRDASKEMEIERLKTNLVSLVTHELRGPSTVIRMYLELLRDEKESSRGEAKKEYLGEIAKANDKMIELSNSLLSVFRVSFGDIVINPEPTFVTEIADAVVQQQALATTSKKISVQKEYDEGLPAIEADKKLVELIFSNLLSNAIKYTPNEGRVRLEIKQQEKELRISVADTGVGIPKNEHGKIFTKFYRGSNVSDISGAGVGLHVLKSMLESAGCRIWFESEEQKGSTFFVAIPLSGMTKVGK